MKYFVVVIFLIGLVGFVFADEPETPSPLEQQKSGKNQEDVKCKQDMFLAFKTDKTRSSCVKPYTLDKLIERGWALPHQDVNNWDVKRKTSEQQSAFCSDGEIKISGGYYKTQDSTLELEWIKDIVDKEYRQGVEVRLYNPEEYQQHAYVYVDCIMPSIDSFEDCLDAGYAIMESYPRQCRTMDGKNFVEEISTLEVKINGEKQVRRGTAQTLEIQVLRGDAMIEGARVFIDIEDYGEDIIREFEGYTNSRGIFVFSWEIPQRFDDIETLLAIIDVTDNISSKTELFKFRVYCLPGEKGCKVEGN